MALDKIEKINGRGVYVPGADIDTDRIIPARFMKCVTFDGLGDYLFYDVRKTEAGKNRDHPLNDPRFAGSTILLSGINFGCGSSREHAPQAINRFGFRAIVAESFAEIFFGNCTTLGMPCVVASREDIETLAADIDADPSLEITIDVVNRKITYGDKSVPVELPDSARDALINGRWDPIGELMESAVATGDTVEKLGYR